MKIDKDNSLPIYIQLKDIIEKQISEGILQPGQKIPSERQLSEEYKISRMTTRQAINELVKEGKLYREKGRGTFVSSPRFLQENMMSFTETIKSQGYNPETNVLEFETVRNLKDISKKLDTPKEQIYYKIKRLRFADLIPVALETVYIPKNYCEDLDKYNLATDSLYNILTKEYHHSISSTFSTLEAILSDKMMMKIFQVNKAIPLLKAEGITRTEEGKNLFYEISYYRSDIYTYKVNIYRKKTGWG
ncbi:GntR family transcriptional regulator [Defluviitalea phaphyphila]|uniref:GntR family transcriptional regulator n=1 Tax=Defluviitalea phaphyphila TaxID=1473580 RepID=UPI0007303691|nr:GntR family transcriptional regulator [Defluviitalea phaphyphila]